MSQTQTVPPQADDRSRSTTRNVLVVVALLWTVQLVSLVAALSGIAQADVAIHFRTTQIAWFTLMTLLTGTFFLPFMVKGAALFGKKRVLLVATGLGFAGDLLAAVATDYRTLLIGRGLAGVYAATMPIGYAWEIPRAGTRIAPWRWVAWLGLWIGVLLL
ncbi:MFS transporter, partial [Streptomyces sp. NPDC005921]